VLDRSVLNGPQVATWVLQEAPARVEVAPLINGKAVAAPVEPEGVRYGPAGHDPEKVHEKPYPDGWVIHSPPEIKEPLEKLDGFTIGWRELPILPRVNDEIDVKAADPEFHQCLEHSFRVADVDGTDSHDAPAVQFVISQLLYTGLDLAERSITPGARSDQVVQPSRPVQADANLKAIARKEATPLSIE